MCELAAIIEKRHADDVIETLREAGIYDRSRRIEAISTGELAIPVREPIESPLIDRFATDVATTRRRRTLTDILRGRGWDEATLGDVPRSYSRIGEIILVSDEVPTDPDAVASALLELHGDARTVLRQVDINHERREPTIEHLGGEVTTRTVHREHGIKYALDLDEVMFSPGNQRERVRMGELVEAGEVVLDCCAGIGYFTLPMAAAGAHVTAIERNPRAFRWLSINLTLNDLDERIVPVRGDCRMTPVTADRVVIGHLPVHDCRDDPTDFGGDYLDTAVRALTDGGWLHVHGIAWTGAHDDAATQLRHRLETVGASVRAVEPIQVKSIAPRTDHLVFDVAVDETTRNDTRRQYL